MNKNSSPVKKGTLTLFAFFAMTASMVMTVYEYPAFASSGFNLVFFLLLGGFLWFLPVALCAAEMATVKGWEKGGIFAWVGNTLGEKWGFAAIFFQWLQITVGFVTMIYFVLGCLSYILDYGALATDPIVRFIAVLIVFWFLTFSQLGGTKNTAKIAKVGFIFGIILPAVILFGLSIAYIAQGNPIDVKIGWEYFVPDFTKVNTLVIFVSFILAYMGVEASASHVNELQNAKKNYPLAMIMLVVLAIVLNTVGGLTVAAVISKVDLSLSAGVVDAFKVLILHFVPGGEILAKVIAVLLALGVMGEISAWVVGPSRGMYEAAEKGLLPKALTKTNKHDVPVNLVMLQGAIVTVWAAVLTLGGGGNNVSFLTAISLTVVIYLVAYLLFFIGYFVLILKKDNLERAYHVPGGKVMKLIISGVGFLVSIFALVISFVPPAQLSGSAANEYLLILGISFVVTLVIPFIIYHFMKKKRV